jgi:hypothetical protein
VVIGNLDVKSVSTSPTEAHSILIVDAHAMLARAVSLQSLQMIGWRRREIPQFIGAIDLYQPPKRGLRDLLKAPYWLPLKNRFRVLAMKRPDQTSIILRLASNGGKRTVGGADRSRTGE